MIRLLKKIKRVFHREILDPFLLLFFASTDDAICRAYNSKSVFAEAIISNFMQGMLLFGVDKNEKMFWFRKNRLYWQLLKYRGVITPESAHISRRLKGYMNKQLFEIKINTDYEGVIRGCQREDETWITEELIALYEIINEKGYIHTIESYQNGKLVGGILGIVIGKTFSILSMFHEVNKSGAFALGSLVNRLLGGEFNLIDCGSNNDTFKRYGAITITKNEFIQLVVNGMGK